MLNKLNIKIDSKKKLKRKSTKEEKRITEKIIDKKIYLIFFKLGFFCHKLIIRIRKRIWFS